MRTLAFLAIAFTTQLANGQSRDTDLNVAIFAYMPDASTAVEKLEDAFEQRYSSIDLDLELWNPYDDAFKDDGLSQIVDFDLVEIDTCRIDQLMGGAFGGLDAIPAEIRRGADSYVGPATTSMKTDIGKYVVPHWVCGNYLQVWASNQDVVNAKTFDEFIAAVDPAAKRPLLAAMWGSTGLGEYYTDAYLDKHGPQKTREHLLQLESGKADLDSASKDAVLKLIKELNSDNQQHLSHFYNHSYFFPRQFASQKSAVLLGYSERLYYTERELQLTPDAYPPNIKPDDIVIRQFSFSNKSQGTPSWIDGFVIPKGRLATKHAAIVAFLQFIQTNDAYLHFAEPAEYFAPSYLLPATADAYDKDSPVVAKQPLLPKFHAAMSSEFPVSNSKVWQGMRAAGDNLKAIIKPE